MIFTLAPIILASGIIGSASAMREEPVSFPSLSSPTNTLLAARKDPTARRNLLNNDDNCPETPLLWKIRNVQTNDHVAFGFGTMHIPRQEAMTNASWASRSNALDDVCEVYGELNLLDEQLMMDIMMCVMKSAVTGSSSSKNKNAPSTTMKEKNATIPVDKSNDKEAGNNDDEAEDFLDLDILQRGRPAGSLETIESNCQFLVDHPELLLEADEEVDPEMIQHYRCGNLDAINEMAADSANNYGEELMYKLLDERNIQMTNEMIHIMQQDNNNLPMFAIGALHWTYGDNSIEKLLDQEGYRLERVDTYGANELEDLTDDMCLQTEELSLETSAASGTSVSLIVGAIFLVANLLLLS